ncbi:MAG TPA: L-seryl-tRNA(Sec) selenium transferase [Planctomycetota bacterium]
MNALLEQGVARGLHAQGREALREALHQSLDDYRARWRARGPGVPAEPIGPAFWAEVEARLAVTPAVALRRALNATGVVLHTGLGRAPWPAEAAGAAVAASRYAVLEIDRDTGGRGQRENGVEALLRRVTGCEGALAVNNNAAAVLLMVAALARGRKVVLARGEMVEIGGSYRLPEVVAAAGAELVEVGTTNRVRAEDYVQALADPAVALVLKVHPSNFEARGFVAEATLDELREPCRARSVPLVYDLGSGVLAGTALPVAAGEPSVLAALRAGADLVSFSGDKLLGGPQAGLVVGAAPLIGRLRRDMLTRCLRLDKTLLAALEATLALHALGERAATARIPALRMLAVAAEELHARATALAQRVRAAVPGVEVEVVASEGRVGSGAAPNAALPSAALAVAAGSQGGAALARRLRCGEPPVFGLLRDERLLLDLRTVAPEEEDRLLQALVSACRPSA